MKAFHFPSFSQFLTKAELYIIHLGNGTVVFVYCFARLADIWDCIDNDFLENWGDFLDKIC